MIRVVTKIDLFANAVPDGVVGLCLVDGTGIDSLMKRIRDQLSSRIDSDPDLLALRAGMWTSSCRRLSASTAR